MNKNTLSYILGGIALILLIIVVLQGFGYLNLTGFESSGKLKVVPKDKIGQKTIDFIKNNLASPDTKFDLKEVTENNGMYEVKFGVMNQEDTAYVTKNGKYLFFRPIDMMPPAPQEIPKKDKAKVDLFVMSFCPFGNQAEETIKPVIDLLGDKIDASLHYIIYSNYQSGYPDYCIDKDNKYCSMHGVQEVHQDIRELCVKKYQPDKLWNFVEAINKNATAQDVDSKWESIARDSGIDVEKIKTCQKDEGTTLLDEEIALTKQKYPVQDPSKHNGKESQTISGSPTLVINGMVFDGDRSVEGYQEGICSGFNQSPSECEQKLENSDSSHSTPGSCE